MNVCLRHEDPHWTNQFAVDGRLVHDKGKPLGADLVLRVKGQGRGRAVEAAPSELNSALKRPERTSGG